MIKWKIHDDVVSGHLEVGQSDLGADVYLRDNGLWRSVVWLQPAMLRGRLTQQEVEMASFTEIIAWTEENLKSEMHKHLISTVEESYK